MSSVIKFCTVTIPNLYRPSQQIESIKGTERYQMEPEKEAAFKEWQARAKVARNIAFTVLAVTAVGGVATLGTLIALQSMGVVDITAIQGMMNAVSGVFSGLRTVMSMGMEMQTPTDVSNGFVNFILKAGVSCYNTTILMGLAPVDFLPGGYMLAMIFHWKVFKEGGLTYPGQVLLLGPVGQAISELKPVEDLKALGKGTWQKASDISEEMFNSFYKRGMFRAGTAPLGHNVSGMEVVRV